LSYRSERRINKFDSHLYLLYLRRSDYRIRTAPKTVALHRKPYVKSVGFSWMFELFLEYKLAAYPSDDPSQRRFFLGQNFSNLLQQILLENSCLKYND
jgi:hypothetical protein